MIMSGTVLSTSGSKADSKSLANFRITSRSSTMTFTWKMKQLNKSNCLVIALLTLFIEQISRFMSNEPVTPIKRKQVDCPPSSAKKRARMEPFNWRCDWELLKEFRKELEAPVDRIGCEKLADVTADKDTFNFQILVAAMLSSQTKDAKTAEAMNRLKSKGLTVKEVALSDEIELAETIKSVCFHKTKAKHMIKTSNYLKEFHDGKVPESLEDLMKLPGVGPKMATLVMSCAFGKTQAGMCVDTHVHRLANLLRWGCQMCSECKTPEHTRQALESWLPQDLWSEVNLAFVGLGQVMQSQREDVFQRVLQSSQPLEIADLLQRLGFRPPKNSEKHWLKLIAHTSFEYFSD